MSQESIVPTQEEVLSESVNFKAFHEALVFAYRELSQLDRMLRFKMSVRRKDIVDDGPLNDVVFKLLEHMEADGHLTELLLSALAFKPDNPTLKQFARGHLQGDAPAELAKLAGVDQSRDRTPSPSASFRRSTTFTIGFLRHAVQNVAACVGRIENNDGPLATGFLVAPDLILTCKYVIAGVKDPPATMRIRFPDWRKDTAVESRVVSLAANWGVASSRLEDLDYLLLRLSEPAGKDPGLLPERHRGWLQLATERPNGREGVVESDILQLHYPNGGELSASFVTLLGGSSPTRLNYDYGTAPGSGGCPCLNRNFDVVAMHEQRSGDGLRGEGIYAADILNDFARQGIQLSPQ